MKRIALFKLLPALIMFCVIFGITMSQASKNEERYVEYTNAYIESTTAKVILDQSTDRQLLSKLDAVSGTVDSSGNKSKEPVFHIKAVYQADVDKIEIHLPAWLLTAASEKKVSRISIESEFADISLFPDTVDAAGFNELVISLTKENNAEILNKLKIPVRDYSLYSFKMLLDSMEIGEFRPVNITLPYQIEPREKITVYHINKDWEFERPISKYDETAKKLEISALYTGKYVIYRTH